MKKQITCQVPPEADGKSLEWVLQRLMGLSRREISQAKFRTEGICVNQIQCKVTRRVQEGDWIEVCLEEENTLSHLKPTPGHLKILYEDGDVLAVCKPAGLVCHPSGGHYRDTLANIMEYYFQEKGEQAVIRLIGRLDQETSGIVLAAKSQAAASRLNQQREQGLLKKEYRALVQGCPAPASGCIREPIGPIYSQQDSIGKEVEMETEIGGTGRERIRMQVVSHGRPAETHYETLETRDGVSFLRLWLGTGRTHQIRVHMAWLGCPLLGDTLYNPKMLTGKDLHGFSHAALHAMRLEFFQPFTGEHICLEAPLPEEYAGWAGNSCVSKKSIV